MFTKYMSYIVLLLAVAVYHHTDGRAVHKACSELGVGVTVSSLVLTDTPRHLEVNWWFADPLDGDVVALYDEEPSADVTPLAVVMVYDVSGYNSTDIQAATTNSSELAFTPQCLGYWAAYARGDQILASSCLGTAPSWMSDHSGVIEDMKLTEVFLPGTHDAASYKNYAQGDENPVTKYAVTQEEDILSQLIHGVRYMDMRIIYYKDREEVWWTHHGGVPMYPLSVVLNHLKTFMYNTYEIVVFDVHGVNSFSTPEIHADFIAYLEAELAGYLASSTLTWSATLGQVWASGRRLIVTYPDAAIAGVNDNLWPTVHHQWGNVQKVDDLYDYLAGVFNNPPPNTRQWSAMVQLTATPANVITDELGGLRRMADSVNHNVSLWFQGPWGETVNVVAADFFRGTAIVEEAIEWNLRRATGSPCFTTQSRHPEATRKQDAAAIPTFFKYHSAEGKAVY